jgi:hypothetical protein
MVKMDFTNLVVDVEIDALDEVVVMEVRNNQVNVKVTFDPDEFIHLVDELNQVVAKMESGQ